MTALAIIFWVSGGLLIYAQIGYGGLLSVWGRLAPGRAALAWPGDLPLVSVIVAAYNEEDVIGARVANLRALTYPRTEIIVAVDGASDATVARATEAGADRVLALSRAGKVPAQNAAVEAAAGEILAFSDANASWAPDALSRLVDAFGDPQTGYVCGDVAFTAEDGATNQEGLYWRYEMYLRRQESTLASITAGNGAIYAVRRSAYLVVPPVMSHDISLPFKLVKRGWRALYVPEARATEKMAPSIEGEFSRKRRMASRTWPTVMLGGMLSPRGYGPAYALMIFSHRLLRYASPLLHLMALVANAGLLGQSVLYDATFALQLALIALALAAPRLGGRLGLVARYYVWTTASLAAGFIDWLSGRQRVTWERVEGTR
jgi:cellulose synthase/poly-beta-1,6-N-acetylglucosamine synthase-like glycosyltransferase